MAHVLLLLFRHLTRASAMLAALVVVVATAPLAHADRIRDLGTFQGIRSNQLTGYGVVVGLPGTGDDTLEYVTQAMRGVSGRLGVQLPAGIAPGLKNAAAVLVTASVRRRSSSVVPRPWAR